MSKNDGGPAFPGAKLYDGEVDYRTAGMTLRDWFAGQALIGLAAYPGREGESNGPEHKHAEVAYKFADATIAERSK